LEAHVVAFEAAFNIELDRAAVSPRNHQSHTGDDHLWENSVVNTGSMLER
jgi:hypothetical protein